MIIKSIFFSKGQMHRENHDLELSSLNFCWNFLGLRARRILAILRHFKSISCQFSSMSSYGNSFFFLVFQQVLDSTVGSIKMIEEGRRTEHQKVLKVMMQIKLLDDHNGLIKLKVNDELKRCF